jgi:hypothetical protein
MEKRTWTNAETFTAEIQVASFGPTSLSGTTPKWTIRSGRQVVVSGTLPSCDVAAGELARLGRIELPLSAVETPAKLNLEVMINGNANDWDFWVYPTRENSSKPEKILLVDRLSDEAAAHLQEGGRVVLLAKPGEVDSDVQIGFSSIFWNTAWTGGQAPHTLGVLCDPAHPALAEFVTDGHSDWQWWELVSRSKPMVLDALSPELRPIVQVVPDWFRPKRLGLVLEASVGEGKLLVCSIDLSSDLESRPVAQQLRHSLLQYAASDDFQPSTAVEVDHIRKLFRQPTLLQQLGATATADSAHRGYAPAQAIDGDPRTIWHTAWEPQPAPMPHTLVLELAETCELAGLRYIPRQDMANGRIAQYQIYLSHDGRDWGDPVASGTFPDGTDTQIVRFEAPHAARYLKLSVLSEVSGKPFASAAEIDVLPAK